MITSKIIYDVKESVRAYSNDAVITNARILHLVDVLRIKYLRQHQQRNLGESTYEYTQTLKVELERVDRSMMPDKFLINKQVLKSIKKIPKLLNRNYFKSLEIKPIDMLSMEIDFMAKQRAVYFIDESESYSCAFLDDNQYLYIIGSGAMFLTLQNVTLTGTLEVPTDIINFNVLIEEMIEYPLPEHIWSMMKLELLELLFKELNIPIDTVSDNKTIQ